MINFIYFILKNQFLLFTYLISLLYNQLNLKEGVHYGLSSNHKLPCLQ